jgi:ParB-like chromosome segregation protein Spo0J
MVFRNVHESRDQKSMKQVQMPKTEWIKTEKLNEWSKNPRIISEHAMNRLKQSIQRNPALLMKRPLLAYVDKAGRTIVYAGNQRLKAAREMGWEEVPVIIDKEIKEKQMIEEAMIDNVAFGELVIEQVRALKIDENFLLEIADIKLNVEEIPKMNNKEITESDIDEDFDTECPKCGFAFVR